MGASVLPRNSATMLAVIADILNSLNRLTKKGRKKRAF
jgi:hypothetical protein